MKCKEIQEKDMINFQLLNTKKVEKLKEKGITLIALVVTIIILLILAGVTLNMAISGDGLFSRARNAADKYKKAQKDEQELISEIGKEMNSEYVGAYVTGYTPTSGSCTITGDQSGTGADQEFKTENETKDENELKWKIWDYDGTTLRIILNKRTTQALTLKGATGYNNGVWAINEICRKCFGQYENGEMKSGISVANLKRSDIQKVIQFDYTKSTCELSASESGESRTVKFGEIDSFDNGGGMTVPSLWYNKDKNWNDDEKDCLNWESEETRNI